MGIIVLGLLTGLGAAERKPFDIPAGTADKTLKQFTAQSGAEVVYAAEVVRGLTTPAVRGNLTPAEALDQLLANSPLSARQDSRNGTFMIARDPNGQRAAPAPASVRPVNNPVVGETVQLSPFVISDSVDSGWIATETLAGSRLRTDFRDVPNQIETLTKEFMSDLAVTNLEEAMSYTANVESIFEYGAGRTSIQAGSRVRSLGNGTLTRNFFTIHNLTDNFSLERVTVASGPNAILFGLGSASGIMDATPARAKMRNRYGFEVQYDSEDSKRGTFDANVVVLPEKFAVRLMGLSKRGFSSIKPNLDRDERLYGALTFAPFKHTKLILQGERANRNLNRAIRLPPADYVTPWLYANQIPGSGYTSARPTYNNTSLAAIAGNRIFVQHSEAPLVIAGDSGPMRSWRNSVTVRNPSQLPGVDPVFDSGLIVTLRDSAIFPFDVNVTGTARTSLLGAITKTAILEQRLADNLFLELAYNRENAYDHRFYAGGASSGNDWAVYADANQFIPGTNTPNPNLGKLYFQGLTPTNLEFEDREDWRATLSYEIDLARKFSDRGVWGRWLGRHRVAGLYTQSQSDIRRQGAFNRRILDEPSLPGVTLRARTFQNWAVHVSRIPQFRHYFDNPYQTPGAPGSLTADWTMTDANGRPYTLYSLETPLRAANGQRLAAGGVTAASLNQANAQILAWQGFFLPDQKHRDRLVLTYGWRKDTAKSAPLDLGSVTRDFSGLYPVIWDVRYDRYGASQSGINRNLGVVTRPIPWASVFYNHSTTFDLNIGRFDPFGNEIPGAGGRGKDYGVRFDLLADKISLRVNRYENSIGPTTTTNQIAAFVSNFGTLENRVQELDPSAPRLNVNDGNRRGFPIAGSGNYFITVNGRARGYELELNLTPTPNWNIRLNGAKSEAMESDIGKAWYAWRDARLPVWQAIVAKNGEVDAVGRPVTWSTARISSASSQTLEQYYNNTIVGQAFAFMSAADGRSKDNARPLRGNLITNYRFSEGLLKGFNVGGVVRYRAAPNLGYGTKTSPGGTTIFDLDKEYIGQPETYVDFLAGYRGRLKAFGGFNYRVQLNVRNVLNKHDPVPAAAFTTGETYRLYLVEPRLFVTSFAVDF